MMGGVGYLRRKIGSKGAILAAWVLALYPGAAYWAGLPYAYSLIFPFSLLLLIALNELEACRGWRLVGLSLLMGLAYLGYDFAAFFIPSTLLVLLARRRIVAALAAVAIQAAPAAIWLAFVVHGLKQPLENSNSGIYHQVVGAYLDLSRYHTLWPHLRLILSDGAGIFFGANFIFLPALFLAAVAINAVTSRTKLSRAEGALLLTALGLFLFLNLAPDYGGTWIMRGTWISRIYQPIFAALVFFLARWWQELPPLARPARTGIIALVLIASAGNALIVFGPIANNPWSISENAFYRFYNHTDRHQAYANSLAQLGRRPLGFDREQPKALDSRGVLAAERAGLTAARAALQETRRLLVQNRRAYLDAARALAANQFELIRIASGLHPDVTPSGSRPAKSLPHSPDELLPAPAQEMARDPSLTTLPPPVPVDPQEVLTRAEVKAQIATLTLENQQLSKTLAETMGQLGKTQQELGQAITDLQKARSELDAKVKAAAR
jgi:hypothetical protein